jgi:hypothetical protein
MWVQFNTRANLPHAAALDSHREFCAKNFSGHRRNQVGLEREAAVEAIVLADSDFQCNCAFEPRELANFYFQQLLTNTQLVSVNWRFLHSDKRDLALESSIRRGRLQNDRHSAVENEI